VHCIDQAGRRGALGLMAALAATAAGCVSVPQRRAAPTPAAVPPAPAAVGPAPARAPSAPVAAPAAPVPPAAPAGPATAARPAAPQMAAAPASPALPPAASAAAVPSGRLAPLGPATVLPAAAPARSWDDFKKAAARRMVQASPRGSFLGKVPSLLFGIPILEIELGADGSVRNVSVVRPPANAEAADTVALAIEAIRRGGPYGDVSRLPQPWKWTEVFLFDNERRFKPRSLE
jgi:hypothetical protein